MPNKRIIGVYGASGFGREVMPLIKEQIKSKDESYQITKCVFIDDSLSKKISSINGYEIIDWEQFLAKKCDNKEVVIAISNISIRQKLEKQISDSGIKLLNVFSNSSKRYDNVEIAEGSIITDGCIMTSNIQIGKCFHANLNSYVAHDCVIGNFVTFAPSVKCNGNVHIQDNVYIGTGVIIKQGKPNKPLIIGKGSKIDAGSYVTRDVEPNSTMFGVPAKKLTLSHLKAMRN